MIYTIKAPEGVISGANGFRSCVAEAGSSKRRVAQTRVSNTGLDSQPAFQVGIDWLDITFRNVPTRADLDDILAEIEALTGDSIDFSSSRATFNGKNWDGSGRGVIGTLVWYDSCDRASGGELIPAQLKIAMSGRVMAGIDPQKLYRWLLTRAAQNELDCTRIDISLDDRDRCVEMWQITDASLHGDFFNAQYSQIANGGKRGQDRGVTVYFGAPSSSRRLRIYDKMVESKGKIKGIRWEVEFRKKLAKEALIQWLGEMSNGTEKVICWCKNVVAGAVDFRERSSDDPNRDRCPTLKWFAKFKQQLFATATVIRAPRVEQTLQKSIDWIIKSVAPSLACLRSVLAEDFSKFLNETINNGGERLTNVRRKLLERTKRETLCY